MLAASRPVSPIRQERVLTPRAIFITSAFCLERESGQILSSLVGVVSATTKRSAMLKTSISYLLRFAENGGQNESLVEMGLHDVMDRGNVKGDLEPAEEDNICSQNHDLIIRLISDWNF